MNTPSDPPPGFRLEPEETETCDWGMYGLEHCPKGGTTAIVDGVDHIAHGCDDHAERMLRLASEPDPEPGRKPEMEPSSAFEQEDPATHSAMTPDSWDRNEPPGNVVWDNEREQWVEVDPPSLGEVSFEQSDLPDPLDISDADAMAVLAGALGHLPPTSPIAWDILAWAKNNIDDYAASLWEGGFVDQDGIQKAAALYWLGIQIDALTRRLQATDGASGMIQAHYFNEAIRPTAEGAPTA